MEIIERIYENLNKSGKKAYELCKEWGINPFIDLNSNRGHPESIPKRLTVDGDGTPLCAADFRMVY